MVMNNECQALCVAMEMERRAIRIYERALMLTEDEQVRAGVEAILRDEREHLRRFGEMRQCHPIDAQEEKQLLAAMGAEVILQGGVMAMKREQALDSLLGLYLYAAENEAGAVQTYAEFANKCDDARVKQAFMDIVQEESAHLTELQEKVQSMQK